MLIIGNISFGLLYHVYTELLASINFLEFDFILSFQSKPIKEAEHHTWGYGGDITLWEYAIPMVLLLLFREVLNYFRHKVTKLTDFRREN